MNIKKYLKFLMNCFFVLLLVMVIYVYYFIDLDFGQKFGSGIFYLKGYYGIYEEFGGEMRHGYTKETGIGMYVIPLMMSIFITLIYMYIDQKFHIIPSQKKNG